MSEQRSDREFDQVADEDVEGHRTILEPDDADVEGHRAILVDGDEDDVEGHVQPRRDIDVER